jgi:hypothetical protein
LGAFIALGDERPGRRGLAERRRHAELRRLVVVGIGEVVEVPESPEVVELVGSDLWEVPVVVFVIFVILGDGDLGLIVIIVILGDGDLRLIVILVILVILDDGDLELVAVELVEGDLWTFVSACAEPIVDRVLGARPR